MSRTSTPAPGTARSRRNSRRRLAVGAIALAAAGVAGTVNAAPASAATFSMTGIGIGAQVTTGGVVNANLVQNGPWTTSVSGTRSGPNASGTWGALQLTGATNRLTANAGTRTIESWTTINNAIIRLPNLTVSTGITSLIAKARCVNGVASTSAVRDPYSGPIRVNGVNRVPGVNATLVNDASYVVIGNYQSRSSNGILAADVYVYSKADSRAYVVGYTGASVTC